VTPVPQDEAGREFETLKLWITQNRQRQGLSPSSHQADHPLVYAMLAVLSTHRKGQAPRSFVPLADYRMSIVRLQAEAVRRTRRYYVNAMDEEDVINACRDPKRDVIFETRPLNAENMGGRMTLRREVLATLLAASRSETELVRAAVAIVHGNVSGDIPDIDQKHAAAVMQNVRAERRRGGNHGAMSLFDMHREIVEKPLGPGALPPPKRVRMTDGDSEMSNVAPRLGDNNALLLFSGKVDHIIPKEWQGYLQNLSNLRLWRNEALRFIIDADVEPTEEILQVLAVEAKIELARAVFDGLVCGKDELMLANAITDDAARFVRMNLAEKVLRGAARRAAYLIASMPETPSKFSEPARHATINRLLCRLQYVQAHAWYYAAVSCHMQGRIHAAKYCFEMAFKPMQRQHMYDGNFVHFLCDYLKMCITDGLYWQESLALCNTIPALASSCFGDDSPFERFAAVCLKVVALQQRAAAKIDAQEDAEWAFFIGQRMNGVASQPIPKITAPPARVFK
jgi:hypothetical protein